MDRRTKVDLNMIQFNIRSIKNKYNEFSAFLNLNSIDIALLSETWLCDNDENIYLGNLKEFNYHTKNSDKKGYRGVAILAEKNIQIKKVDNSNFPCRKIEVAIEIIMQENIYILSVYIPPG